MATGVAPCVAFIDNSGQRVLQTFSQNRLGCTAQNADFVSGPAYGPTRFTSLRHPSLRLHSPPNADLSFTRMTKITERLGLQLRVEMFNFTNTYQYRVQQFNADLNNTNFGSLFPRTAADTQVAFPRHIQLAAKFTW